MNLSVNSKKNKSVRRVLIAVVGVIFIVVVALIGASVWQQRNLRPVSDQTKIIRVTIPLGSTTEQIGDILKDAGAIRSSLAFFTYVRSKELESELRAGTYEVDASRSTQEIVKTITEGDEATQLVTIPPGVRLYKIKKRLIQAGYSESEVDAGLNPNLYKNHPALVGKPKEASLEGYLYPESFQITDTTTVQEIIEQSLDQMAERLTPERLQAFASKGLSSHEAIIIASIIEREVPQPVDRRIVAQIFLKRLAEGISLGADATYVYAAAITGEEAYPELDSPYNTRKYTGLPPGPISNVEVTALDAVAYPADTNYLFFVSGDDGKNYWANTQEEHDQNIINYCQLNCQ